MLVYHAYFKIKTWQELELLHNHLQSESGGLKKPLMGDVQADSTRGPVPSHAAVVNPGGDWTSERSTKSTTSQSPIESATLTDSMELRSALEILYGTMETATQGTSISIQALGTVGRRSYPETLTVQV